MYVLCTQIINDYSKALNNYIVEIICLFYLILINFVLNSLEQGIVSKGMATSLEYVVVILILSKTDFGVFFIKLQIS